MDPRNEEFIRLAEESKWSNAEMAQQLELTTGAISHFRTGRTAPSGTVLKLFRTLLNRETVDEMKDAPPRPSDKERADAAEARLERAKKALRAALAELESGVKY